MNGDADDAGPPSRADQLRLEYLEGAFRHALHEYGSGVGRDQPDHRGLRARIRGYLEANLDRVGGLGEHHWETPEYASQFQELYDSRIDKLATDLEAFLAHQERAGIPGSGKLIRHAHKLQYQHDRTCTVILAHLWQSEIKRLIGSRGAESPSLRQRLECYFRH